MMLEGWTQHSDNVQKDDGNLIFGEDHSKNRLRDLQE
jgi:hypothetical protein